MRVALFRSLRFRLIASVVLIEVVMLSIMVWSNVNSIYTTHTDRLNDTAKSILQQFAQTAGTYMAEVDYAGLEEYTSGVLQHSELAYIVVNSASGNPVIRLGKDIPTQSPFTEKHPTYVSDNIFDVSTDISLAEYKQGQVFMGFTLSVMQAAVETARNRSIFIAVTEIVLTIIATIIIGLNLTRNLRALSDAAAHVGEGNFKVVLPVTRDDEVGQTARAFNNMVNELGVYREHLEELVDKRTEELKTANEELEAFNASIAHDLRTPINAISNYCQIMHSEFAEELSGTGEDSLVFIKETAFNMSRLINDMLQMSRASQIDLEKEEVNLSLITEEILQKLSNLDPERQIEFNIERDLYCYADRGEMIILMDNLLSNAWKYTSKNADASIEFGKIYKENEDYFYVKDNGAGFNMEDIGKLFEPFKRLHKNSEFLGTGIGLTTVDRIVKKHAGRIWAEAEVNKGATFFINLPAH